MKLEKAGKRDKKRHKKRHGMVITGKSVFLNQEALIKKAEEIKRKEKND